MASVLLIEDDQRIRQSLATRLAERGHDVESTATAMDGVQKAVSGNVDVIVLDLGLPDVDGSEALQMIRAVSEVPVIVATARDDQDEIVKIFDAGVSPKGCYMAMEFVVGKDCRKIIDRAREDGQRVPVEVALFIARDLADALGVQKASLYYYIDSKEELLEAVIEHGTKVHHYEDTPEFREQLMNEFKEGIPPV